MFEICIVGHGNYPSGVCSALKLLSGSNENIHHFDLDDNLTHEKYESELKNYLNNHDQVLIFADMTGGAPHQIATRNIVALGKESQYIMSSISLNLVLDLYMKNSMGLLTPENIQVELTKSMNESKEMLLVMPEVDVVLDTTGEISEEEGI